MFFIDWIIEELWDISDFFHDAYYEVKDWVWPFSYLKYPFYGLYGRFMWLARDFEDFNEWVDDTVDKLRDIWSQWDIWDYFRWWFEAAETAYNWFLGRWNWFQKEVADWWSIIWPYVDSYIDKAVEGLSELKVAWDTFWTVTFPQWVTILEDLRATISDFFTTTLPTLIDWQSLLPWWLTKLIDIGELINTAFTEREPFWAGWQDWKDKVTEFFTNPFNWIFTHVIEPIIDDFNKGFDRGMKG